MRWPWQKPPERRDSAASDFYGAVIRLIEQQAAGVAADVSKTAALEAASGLLSRSLAAAELDAPEWVGDTVTPDFLAQVGRDVLRRGSSLHVIRMAGGGIRLIPAASWHWNDGDDDPASWRVRATTYGPSNSVTRFLPADGVVFLRWGSTPGQTYVGLSPLDWASATAKLAAETERSLGDEASGPVANLIPVPEGEFDIDDLSEAITKARGKTLLPESTAGGYGQGKGEAPKRDMEARRLGPAPGEALVGLARDSFARSLAACGASPALFDASDGTSKREALRQWHLATVRPMAKILERELSMKLGAPIKLRFDLYNVDLAGRAQAFQKLVAGGVAVNEALVTAGLLADGDA